MKGRRLKLIPADIVAFGVWKLDHPQGRVLAPNPEIEARGDEYAPSDWERNMARRRVVTTLPKGSPFQARTLIVGITVNGHAKAYALNDLRASRVLLDVVDERPVLIVATDDGRSVRVFDRRVDGRVVEFAATPTSVSITPDAAGPAGRTTAAPRAPLLIDLDTASEWDFAGRAISGPIRRQDPDTATAFARVLVRLADLLAEDGRVQAVAADAEGSRPARGSETNLLTESRRSKGQRSRRGKSKG